MIHRRTGATLELIGPPAAGKSALAAALAADASKVRVVKRYRAAAQLPYVLRAGWIVAKVALRDTGHRPLTREQLTWMVRVEAAVRMLERHSPRDAIIAFDQGPLYTLARLSDVDTLARWRESRTRRLSALLHLVVVVDAPDAVLWERLTTRTKTHRYKDLPAVAAVAALAEARTALDDLVNGLTHRNAPRVLRLDSRAPIAALVDAVLVALGSDNEDRSATRRG
jgi:hypothetical protein